MDQHKFTAPPGTMPSCITTPWPPAGLGVGKEMARDLPTADGAEAGITPWTPHLGHEPSLTLAAPGRQPCMAGASTHPSRGPPPHQNTELAHTQSSSVAGGAPSASASCRAAGSSRTHASRRPFWRSLRQ